MEEISAQEVAQKIIETLKDDASDLWERMSAKAKEEVSWAAKRIGKLTLRALKGEDVEQDILGLEAIIANWSYVHASESVRAFWASVDKVIGVGGRFVGFVAAEALKRLAGG